MAAREEWKALLEAKREVGVEVFLVETACPPLAHRDRWFEYRALEARDGYMLAEPYWLRCRKGRRSVPRGQVVRLLYSQGLKRIAPNP